ncbi:type I-F CRISPR-associated endoribonuclease Cas6/Csy4 [Hydrocarboniphaga sp.]|uniref:type I-F CRISPR-associated endoribonuclease Cas6/Csy4 n=1 Tax=Hydrocarboniphaga sp. TaxID=2033016 RepID=UPI003D108D38
MTHHIDIRLRPDPDFASQTLMDALFSKLHRALAHRGQGDVGVSFPGYDGYRLGTQMRLHGSADSLSQLMEQAWLAGMLDHVIAGPIAQSPQGATHRVVRRVQAKSSPERLRRRQMRRHGLTAEQALERVPDSARETIRLPYLQLKSSSTAQAFRLFIDHGPLLEQAQPGHFGSYGLSDTATVPWF